MFQKFTLFATCFCFFTNLTAQTGPGGIGEKNSNGKLRMWYDFSDCSSTDYGGTGIGFSIIKNQANSQEVISSGYDYDSQYGLELSGSLSLTEHYASSSELISRGLANFNAIFPFGEYIVAFEQDGFTPVYGVSENGYWGLGFERDGSRLTLNYFTHETYSPVTESAGFFNADSKNIASFYGINQYSTGTGRVRIRMASGSGPSNPLEINFPYFMSYFGIFTPPEKNPITHGKIHEIIAFHGELSEVERHIVFTYLSGKYGLPYNSLLSNSIDPDFDLYLRHQIVGIGYKSGGGSVSSANSGEINMSFTPPNTGLSYAFLGHDIIGINNYPFEVYEGACIKNFDSTYTPYSNNQYSNLEKYNRKWQYKETADSNGKDPGDITFSISESMVPNGYFPAMLISSDPTFPTTGPNTTQVIFLQHDDINNIYFTKRNIDQNTYISLARRTFSGDPCPNIQVNLSKKVFCENDGAKNSTWTTSHPGVFSGTGFTLLEDHKYSFDPKGLMGNVPITFTLNDSVPNCVKTKITNFTVQPRNQILGLPPIICYEGRDQINLNLTPGGGTLTSSTGGVSGSSYTPANAGFGSKVIKYSGSNSTTCPAVTAETYIYNNPDYLDNILSASSVTYSDNWPLDHEHSASAHLIQLSNSNFFAGAHKGIWRNEESYTYVTQRKQNLDSDNKNVLLTSKATLVGGEGTEKTTSGTFDNMPMFEWHNADMGVCFPNWRRMETVEKYNSFGYETVSRDVLNRHAAALYGFNGKLVTAQASNAMQNEIAFEPFEDYTLNQVIKSSSDLKGSNLSFYSSLPSVANNQYHEYIISRGFENKATLMIPFDASLAGKEIKLFGANLSQVYAGIERNSFNDKNIHGLFKIASIEPDPEAETSRSIIKIESITYPNPTGHWKGKLSFYESNTNAEFVVPAEKVEISATKAHTGKQSLQLKANVALEQENLCLEENKKYVISAWVSTTETGVATFKSKAFDNNKRGIRLKISEGGSAAHTLLFEPTGDVIEGWQKIEGEFIATTTTADIIMEIQVPSQCAECYDYYDDIRIHPVNAGLQTYVYNKLNLKVSAVLDQNNYATLYYYDPAGNLFLVKKETEKGIMTIQETFSHQKESQ